jgi:hypothetical protein
MGCGRGVNLFTQKQKYGQKDNRKDKKKQSPMRGSNPQP